MTALIQPFCGRPGHVVGSLAWLAALHMNEQTGRVEVNVAGEIEIVDLGPLKGGRLLCSNVRRKKQQPVLSVFGWQSPLDVGSAGRR